MNTLLRATGHWRRPQYQRRLMQSSTECVYHLLDIINTTSSYLVRCDNGKDRDTVTILPSLPGFFLPSQDAGIAKDNKGL